MEVRNDFKLLAIRPLDGCDQKYLKVLTEGEIYKFYNDYEFVRRDEDDIFSDIINIKHESTVLESLYDIEGTKINISAIVGRNGSGKSSLIELLFIALYNFSVEKKIVEKYKNKRLKIEEGVNVEIYYIVNNVIYIFKINTLHDNSKKKQDYKISITIGNYDDVKEVRVFKLLTILDDEIEKINQLFFYTISINYSHHSLNSEQIGNWINPMFHKNDSYQVPIVINPMREKGVFDINNEDDLLKQRLLSNIFEPINEPIGSLRELASKKIAVKIELTFDSDKVESYRNKNLKVENGEKCVEILYKKYTGYDIRFSVPSEPDLLDTQSYILFKLVKICKTYGRYKKDYKKNQFVDIDKFTNKIIKDSSHITFKIKQALNFLRHKIYHNWKNKESEIIDINIFSKHINKIKKEEKIENRKRSTIELIPPSIFKIKILFDNSGSLDDFSSGEKQKIHSISSIIYHLININSVFNNGDENDDEKIYKYKYINIVFDEVELYFHPELQRQFINDLIAYIKKIDPVLINYFDCINILFSTHSPFILSDIPNSNILFLKIDNETNMSIPDTEHNALTFGANIHDLLSDSFFMENGFMGEYSKNKISETIEFINYHSLVKEKELIIKNEEGNTTVEEQRLKEINENITKLDVKNNNFEFHKKIINLIGEPILRNKLQSMLAEILPKDEKIKMLKERFKLLADDAGIEIDFEIKN